MVNAVIPKEVTLDGYTYKVDRLPDIESEANPPIVHLRVRDGNFGGDVLIDSAFLGLAYETGYDPITLQLEHKARLANRLRAEGK